MRIKFIYIYILFDILLYEIEESEISDDPNNQSVIQMFIKSHWQSKIIWQIRHITETEISRKS